MAHGKGIPGYEVEPSRPPVATNNISRNGDLHVPILPQVVTNRNTTGSDSVPASRSTGAAASIVANVLQQLPTGAVLVFQALSASFTNYGECHTSNWWLSLVLVTFLALFCSFFAITDSLVYKHKLYYGMATRKGFRLFNASRDEEQQMVQPLKTEFLRRKREPQDIVRAIFSALVFLSFAAGDKGIQKCFFPRADIDTEQLLKIMPLMMLVISSCVFAVFPTKRKGVDFLYVIRANSQHA